MFNFSVEKKIDTPAEQRLEEIRNILFPPHEAKETLDKETGEMFKFYVDYSADMNLDSAMHDIQEGFADEIVQKTVKDVIDRLYKVRQLLNADQIKYDPDAKYVIVDNMTDDSPEIEAEEQII
jgi:hypothetical protein